MKRQMRLHLLGLMSLLAASMTLPAQAQSPSKGGSTKPTTRTAARPNAKPNTAPVAPTAPMTTKATSPSPAPLPKTTSIVDKSSPAPQSPAPAGSVLLRHKLKAGETLRTRTTHVANTITRVQGTEDVSEAKSVSEKVWEIKSVSADGKITFEYRLEAVDMSQKQGDQPEVTYNSRTDTEAPKIFSMLAETVSKPIGLITIDATGTVTDRENQSKSSTFDMGGMGELAVPLPKDAVAVGAQWSIPRETRVKLENGTYKTIKLREQYTLEKVSAGVATIRVDTHPLTPTDDANVDSQLMQQLSKGTIKFDIDNGRLISKQLDWDEDVVGFRGAESSLKYSARFTEEPI